VLRPLPRPSILTHCASVVVVVFSFFFFLFFFFFSRPLLVAQDQDIIDSSLADSLRLLSNLSVFISGLLVMMCVVQPWFSVALLPLLYFYWYFQRVSLAHAI
jgi:hypothetical protein